MVAHLYLQELHYGIDKYAETYHLVITPIDPRLRFYLNSLIDRIHSGFVAQGGGFIGRNLRDCGVDDELDDVLALLAAPVGNVRFDRVLGLFRDKYLQHNHQLVRRSADAAIARESGLGPGEGAERFYHLFDRVIRALQALAIRVFEEIPADRFERASNERGATGSRPARRPEPKGAARRQSRRRR